MPSPLDPGLEDVLASFGIGPSALVGHGGEAWVYALDEDRVLRILHGGGTAETVLASAELTATLAQSRPPFALPELLDVGERHGRWYAIERRLPGRSVLEELERAEDRAALIEAYLECSAHLGDLRLDQQDWWGDLLATPSVRGNTWHEYLSRKAEASLLAAGPDFDGIAADALAAELPTPASRCFVHLDAFPGNMLTVGRTITAVIDLGVTTVAGDRRLDPVASAVYLAPEITPTATEQDREVARAWLRAAGLSDLYAAVERWLAAYWSFAVDDRRLHAWCRAVLLTNEEVRAVRRAAPFG